MGPPHLHGGCHTGRLSPGGEDCARCPSLGPRSVGGGRTCLWWELTGRRLSGEPVPLQRKDEESGLGDPKKWPPRIPLKDDMSPQQCCQQAWQPLTQSE